MKIKKGFLNYIKTNELHVRILKLATIYFWA